MNEDRLLVLSGALFLAGVALLFAAPSRLVRYAGMGLAVLAVVPLALSRPFQK